MMAGTKRLRVVLSFVVVICLGIPVWWKATAVYRADVPFDEVEKLSAVNRWPLFSTLSSKQANTNSRAVRASTGYRLSFTIANADPSNILPSWDFTTLEKEYLQQVLDKLDVIADFAVDSQVFHYASLLQPPLQDKENYYIPDVSISQYINPNEWKLDYSTDSQPQLNFIVYIPKKAHYPLKIRDNAGVFSPTNAFIIPQWGGVTIYNPPKEYYEDGRTEKQLVLGSKELKEVFLIFVHQLKELLSDSITPQASNDEFDLIMKHHLAENLQTAFSSLVSLANLVNSLPDMMVLDNIRDLVRSSVDSLSEAHSSLEKGDYSAALQASRKALHTSELAFFDSNMLSLLYFPSEHNFAIYAPILLPVCVPIIVGLAQEIKHRRAKKKKE